MSERQMVYVALVGGFDDHRIAGVFTTREAAEDCIAEHGGETYGDLGCLDYVDEWEVQGAPSQPAASGSPTPAP